MTWHHSLNVQIAEVEREIRKRTQVYPRMIAQNKLRENEARELIAIMRSVLRTLQAFQQACDEVTVWKDRYEAAEQALEATIKDCNRTIREERP